MSRFCAMTGKNPILLFFVVSMCWMVYVTGKTFAQAGIQYLEQVPAALQLAVNDLNGDGLVDIAATQIHALAVKSEMGNSAFGVHLFYQTENGFPATPDKTIHVATLPTGLVADDFDGDGHTDLAIGLRRQRSLAILSGVDGFEKQRVSKYNNDSGATTLSVGRLSEGHIDFLTGAAWRRWAGAENFKTGYVKGPTRNDNDKSTLADLNGDGYDDIVFTTRGNTLRVYLGPFPDVGLIGVNNASEVFDLKTPFTDDDKPILSQVMVGDVNNDGQPDLIVGAKQQTLVYFQNSPTGFTNGNGPSLVLEDVRPLYTADLNADDLCDLVLYSGNTRKVTLWHQTQTQPLSADWSGQAKQIVFAHRIGAAVTAGEMAGQQKLFVVLAHKGVAVVTLSQE